MYRLWVGKNEMAQMDVEYSGKCRVEKTAFSHFAFLLTPEGLTNSSHIEMRQTSPEDSHFKRIKWFEREVSPVVDCQSPNREDSRRLGWGGPRTWGAALCFSLCLSLFAPGYHLPLPGPLPLSFLVWLLCFLAFFSGLQVARQLQTEAEVLTVSMQGQGVWWSPWLQVSVQ